MRSSVKEPGFKEAASHTRLPYKVAAFGAGRSSRFIQ
jgi:hypothetical protein